MKKYCIENHCLINHQCDGITDLSSAIFVSYFPFTVRTHICTLFLFGIGLGPGFWRGCYMHGLLCTTMYCVRWMHVHHVQRILKTMLFDVSV